MTKASTACFHLSSKVRHMPRHELVPVLPPSTSASAPREQQRVLQRNNVITRSIPKLLLPTIIFPHIPEGFLGESTARLDPVVHYIHEIEKDRKECRLCSSVFDVTFISPTNFVHLGCYKSRCRKFRELLCPTNDACMSLVSSGKLQQVPTQPTT